MAHAVDSQSSTPANDLRTALSEAERLVVKPNAATVENLLVLLDRIEAMFQQMRSSNADLRGEDGRWEGLQNRLQTRPGLVAKAVSQAGGMAALRAKHPPASNFWWQLDVMHREGVRRAIIRSVSTIAAVLVIVVGGLWAFDYFFPGNESAVLVQNTESTISELVAQQDWAESLQLVDAQLTVSEEKLASLPADGDRVGWESAQVQLLLWKSVLAEQLSDGPQAQTALAQAQKLLPDQQAEVWVVLGNHRYQVGDLAGAEAAAQQTLALIPDEPQALFLLGNVAEARGDVPAAVKLFERVFDVASDSNPALAVTARMRMGMLMQQVVGPPSAPITETVTITDED